MPLLQISPTTTTTTKSLNSPPIPFYHPHYASYFHSNSNPKFKFRPIFSLNLACKGLGVAVSSSPPPDSKLRNKNVDVATLGNLCVDIVLNVPQLPPPSLSQRKAFMERLASSPPSKVVFYSIIFNHSLFYAFPVIVSFAILVFTCLLNLYVCYIIYGLLITFFY